MSTAEDFQVQLCFLDSALVNPWAQSLLTRGDGVQDLAHSSTWDPASALEVARLIHEANRQLRALDGLSQPVFRRHASEVQLP
jgi:hypothetical protein